MLTTGTFCHPTTCRWVVGKTPSVLSAIHREDVNLAIWDREPLRAAEPAVKALAGSRSGVCLRFENLRQELVSLTLAAACGWCCPRSATDTLARDIVELGAWFAAFHGGEKIRARLDTVADDGCALFHVDTLALRMVCTYAGPGTQWAGEENVRREELGLRGRTIEQANRAIIIDRTQIHTASPWQVLVFKGRLAEKPGAAPGLVHRSSPMNGTGTLRLRLTIDQASACCR